MRGHIGLDVGSVTAKAALVYSPGFHSFESNPEISAEGYRTGQVLLNGNHVGYLLTPDIRVRGNPLSTALALLTEIQELVDSEEPLPVRVTGGGGGMVADALDVVRENDFKAIARAVSAMHPEVRTVFEIGGETSRYIQLEPGDNGIAAIVDYDTNGDCAAGTGSFIDQQANRLLYNVEDVGQAVMTAARSPAVAGRCSVFAKSDMIHAQQKGYRPGEILKGLCEAVARNYKAGLTRGREPIPKVAFLGGVAKNQGVVLALMEQFGFSKEDFLVPEHHSSMACLGAALIDWESEKPKAPRSSALTRLESSPSSNNEFPAQKPLDMTGVTLLRDRARPFEFEGKSLPVDAYLGIDVGSVSTNLVVMDEDGRVIKEIYTRTDARPIEVVGAGLREIQDELKGRVNIRGVGTTGSGRELIGQLVGADTINDEITAHKTGASFVGATLLDLQPDTIFEIGGQDSKFISLDDGVVVDFTMNEACAAGTGSFLEERSEELGICIKGEFAAAALSSESPIRLGERCTVFMERDVNSYQLRGAQMPDLVGGLAYSVAYNYINRVVRGRKIGEVIFFQGGTAYNDSVAAAFSKILDKRIIVPPHNGVMGAVGSALLARDKMTRANVPSSFRGYDLDQVDYRLKEFTCKGCTNYCNVQQFRVEEEKTYWGDKCGDRYRKAAKTDLQPVLPDLVKFRSELLLEDGDSREPEDGMRVGIPLAMYTYDRLPFWRTLLRELGFRTILSPETNRAVTMEGEETVVADPCFPIKVAHGHVRLLEEEGADLFLIPNLIDAEAEAGPSESYVCPWGQTLPYVVRSAEKLQGVQGKILCPTVRFSKGAGGVLRDLIPVFKSFGKKAREVRRALEKAYTAQSRFRQSLREKGREALRTLAETGEPGILLLGRPYNIYDRHINLDIPGKLRKFYGVDVVPLDFLSEGPAPVDEAFPDMFWNYGRIILAAARLTNNYPNLHIIYISNFKCGPDSFVKHFVSRVTHRPYLTLQFDGHSNDAGMMTRCEAYLDSKGILRGKAEEQA